MMICDDFCSMNDVPKNPKVLFWNGLEFGNNTMAFFLLSN